MAVMKVVCVNNLLQSRKERPENKLRTDALRGKKALITLAGSAMWKKRGHVGYVSHGSSTVRGPYRYEEFRVFLTPGRCYGTSGGIKL